MKLKSCTIVSERVRVKGSVRGWYLVCMYVSDSACEADVLYIHERTVRVGECV